MLVRDFTEQIAHFINNILCISYFPSLICNSKMLQSQDNVLKYLRIKLRTEQDFSLSLKKDI